MMPPLSSTTSHAMNNKQYRLAFPQAFRHRIWSRHSHCDDRNVNFYISHEAAKTLKKTETSADGAFDWHRQCIQMPAWIIVLKALIHQKQCINLSAISMTARLLCLMPSCEFYPNDINSYQTSTAFHFNQWFESSIYSEWPATNLAQAQPRQPQHSTTLQAD